MIKRKLAFLSGKDDKVKIMNERINIAEKHLGEMCSVFAAFTRKLARLRDKHDEIAKVFKNYSNDEKTNKTLSTSLDSLSTAMTFLADYMDIEVHRIELKVVTEVAHYGTICRNSRENLKTAVSLRDKELHRQKQLYDIKMKFAANSSATDSELLKAKLEVNRSSKDIDEIIGNFEKTRLKDTKTILLDFINIQIKQHVKAVEILSAAYFDVASINEQSDYQDFKKLMKSTTKIQKTIPRELRSQSMDNLEGSHHQVTKSMKEQFSASTKDLRKKIADDTTKVQVKNNEDYTDNESSDTEEHSDDDDSEEKSIQDESSDEDNNEDDNASESLEEGIKAMSKAMKLKTFSERHEIKKVGDFGDSSTSEGSTNIQIKSINCIPRNRL